MENFEMGCVRTSFKIGDTPSSLSSSLKKMTHPQILGSKEVTFAI